MTNLLRVAALWLAACAMIVPGAMAQDLSDISTEGPVLRMQMSGFDVQIPIPGWTEGTEEPALKQVSAKFVAPRPGISTLTLNRAEENAILWTELMGVFAVAVPGYTAGQQFKNLADPLGRRCKTGALELFWIAPLPGSDREALVGLCGEYSLDTRAAQSCDGGVMVAVAIEKPQGVVSAYHEWCEQSFDAKDENKWPVARQELEKRARQLQVFTDFEKSAE